MMTLEELTAEMRRLATIDRTKECLDIEERHVEADNLMIKFIRAQGGDEAMDLFLSMEMWYA
jgi:hypothetical protein